MAGFSVNDFATQATGGFARNNLFEVTISPSRGHEGGWITGANAVNASDMLRMRVKAAQLPGMQVGTVDNKRFGPAYKVVNEVIFEPTTWTILCSEDMRERNSFMGWMSWIHGSSSETASNPAKQFRPRYYDEYVGIANIITYNIQGDSYYEAELIDCFPTSMGPVEQTWGDGAVSEFTVTMNFRYFIPKSGMEGAGSTEEPADPVPVAVEALLASTSRTAEEPPRSNTPWHIVPGAGRNIPDWEWKDMHNKQQMAVVQSVDSSGPPSNTPWHIVPGHKNIPDHEWKAMTKRQKMNL